MLKRCFNPNCHAYKNYGGRGVTVCARWKNDFIAFAHDMGPKPTPKHSIDRINNNGNYEPGNCRWATQKEQCRNYRGNTFLTANGKTQTMIAWSEENSIPVSTIINRLIRGWNQETSVTAPSHSLNKRKLSHLVPAGWSDMAKKAGLKHQTFLNRMKRGWSLEKALTTPVDERFVNNRPKAEAADI